jgi:hypothetical protein
MRLWRGCSTSQRRGRLSSTIRLSIRLSMCLRSYNKKSFSNCQISCRYVPVEKVHERVEYIPVERQIFYPPEDHIETNQSGETPIIRSSGLPQHIMTSSSRPPISMSSRGLQGNVSFQNSGILHQPPQDNSVYTKEPLPSSKRRYIWLFQPSLMSTSEAIIIFWSQLLGLSDC